MKIIGVTGPSGAGKSMLCEQFAKSGIPTINADGVYHSLLIPPSPCLDALRNAFGEKIFLSDGSLDRKALASIVFNDEEKLKLLNSTVLGFVIEKIRDLVVGFEKDGHMYALVDAPTLIESGFYKECHAVVSVLCPSETRIKRIMARDGLDEAAARLRTKAQKSDEFYRRHSDCIIINNSEKDYLKDIDELMKKLII